MAENILETRILLRYGTYAQWMNSDVILRVGEAAVAAFPSARSITGSNIGPENTPPAIGIKIGDGTHYFSELPWVQAVAADVYNWAKAATKPQYTAQEIQGLQSFVENLVGGDADITVAPRIYSFVKGTGTNSSKYYLQYKENSPDADWTIDTSSYIDLSDLAALVDWIGEDIENFPSLGNRTEQHIQYDLEQIKVTDSEQSSQVVTSVSQTKGKISTTKRQLGFNDLTGTASVEQGGTGRTSLPQGEVLLGNDTDPLQSISIGEQVESTRALVYNYAVKAYVDTATAGLTGAMHYIGEALNPITPNGAADPHITGYDFSLAQPGDVITYESKEYVWSGSNWRLLGDEGSYAVKGSIKDADIDADAAIQQSKIQGLAESFGAKVDKVEGKQLSSNDFTDEYRQKLEDVEEGAQRNIIEHIFLNDTEIPAAIKNGIPNSIDLQISEFDEASRQKLATIEEGAQENIIERITMDGEEVTPDGAKTLNLHSDPHTEHENIIESIAVNGVVYPPDRNKQVQITIDQAALNLNVLEGAQIPGAEGTKEEVEQVAKKLQLARVAVSGNVSDLLQTANTYIIFDCGSSTEVI